MKGILLNRAIFQNVRVQKYLEIEMWGKEILNIFITFDCREERSSYLVQITNYDIYSGKILNILLSYGKNAIYWVCGYAIICFLIQLIIFAQQIHTTPTFVLLPNTKFCVQKLFQKKEIKHMKEKECGRREGWRQVRHIKVYR